MPPRVRAPWDASPPIVQIKPDSPRKIRDASYKTRRTYLSLDLDAFYCAVEEQLDPTLKGEPFVVYQKNIVATLNYEARALGLKKLTSLANVEAQFPNMRKVNGESLAPYRAAGSMLVDWLRSIIPGPIERLGLEEMRVDITDAVHRAIDRLDLEQYTSTDTGTLPDEAASGVALPFYETTVHTQDFFFSFDGITWPPNRSSFGQAGDCIDFYVAGHFAQYIKERMALDTGYKCSIGVGSSVSLAKMACSLNKPHGVSVLLPGHEYEFLQNQPLRAIPGFGSSTIAQLIAKFNLTESPTVNELHSKATRSQFLQLSTDILWDLSLGNEISPIQDWVLPKSVSIEDTFKVPIGPTEQRNVIERLVHSLMNQAEHDLVRDGVWLAKPLQFRVTVAATARRSKSQRLKMTPDIPQYTQTLVRIGRRLLAELGNAPVRLINVAFVLSST